MSLRDAPPLPDRIEVEFTSPGGVVLKRFSDPSAPTGWSYLPMRVCVGQVEDPHDGLIVEMRSGRPPAERAPWESAAVRAQAADDLRTASSWLAPSLRAQLLAHIASTPWYE
jgi:hypothetical protein